VIDRANAPGRPKRSLAQNFLVDPNIQRRIVSELDAREGDAVLEIGPGQGALTGHLVGRVSRLTAVEKDEDLAGALRERWGAEPGVEIVSGDALKIDLCQFARAAAAEGCDLLAVSNVPYNIISPIIFTLLDIQPAPKVIVLMVQHEVAERMAAAPGGRCYGALSVGVQAAATVSMRFRVGRMAFRPVPRVDSAVVRLEPRSASPRRPSPSALRQITRACFNRRRKQMGTIARTAPEFRRSGRAVLEQLGIDPSCRPETLSPEIFLQMTDLLAHDPDQPTGA